MDMRGGKKINLTKVTIPEEIEETDEAYIEYAKPLIQKLADEELVKFDSNLALEYEVGFSRRIAADDLKFDFDINVGKYNDQGIMVDYENRGIYIHLAKENEYRHALVPILQEVEIIKKEDKNYLKGTMEITSTSYGYNNSTLSEEYPPKITLVDDYNNNYETTVTSAENSIYYFEVELDNIEMGKEYKIQATETDPNNKYPSNTIDATLQEGVTIDVTDDNTRIKSINSELFVKLSIEADKYFIGNVNGDDVINTSDARFTLLAYIGETELSEQAKEAADVNKDGLVNTADARRILLYYIGEITEL